MRASQAFNAGSIPVTCSSFKKPLYVVFYVLTAGKYFMFFNTKSKLISENTDNQELRKNFNKKFNSLNLGRMIECGIHLPWLKEPIKTVQKGKDVYHVSDASFFSVEETDEGKIYSHTHAFLAENNGRFQQILFTSTAVPFLEDWHKKEHVEAKLGDEHIVLPNTTDLFDVYDLRFHLRNNKQAKQFMDDFVIVGSLERKRYKLYEIKKLYQEKKMKSLEKKVLPWNKSRGNRR